MRIMVEDTLALVIDFQERLVPVIDNSKNLLNNTVRLLKGLNILNVPVLITQQYTKGLGMTVPKLTEAFGESFTYYDKTTFSCAQDEFINQAIITSGKKNIIICGVEAHVCVLQSVIDLLAEGYRVILVEDCIGSRKENDRQTGIKRALTEGAIPATYESILFELTQISNTDTFRKISKLIKE